MGKSKIYNFQNTLTIGIFYRHDTDERLKNLRIVLNYYKNNTNCKFIIVEDGSIPTLESLDILPNPSEDKYFFIPNAGEWNKSRGYNLILNACDTKCVLFNDVDCIIQPKQIEFAVNYLTSPRSKCIIYPYNGEFVCVNSKTKEDFIQFPFFDQLYSKYEQMDYTPMPYNYNNTPMFMGHNNSRGGVVMAVVETLKKAGGYNPNFSGWGYEDDEMPSRVAKLGYEVTRIDYPGWPCFHFPHDGEGASRKADQPNYNKNYKIKKFIEDATKEEIQKYISTWEI
jgi:predicted glycosyltransferase involved in capsule biosynthesis